MKNTITHSQAIDLAIAYSNYCAAHENNPDNIGYSALSLYNIQKETKIEMVKNEALGLDYLAR
jgi:ABC-type phosphate transport system substrate-binding protein